MANIKYFNKTSSFTSLIIHEYGNEPPVIIYINNNDN
jgi:hypothetical protein